jgi:LysM repeat protein
VPRSRDIPRFAAPAAFLVVVTVAALLIRSGLNHNKGGSTPPTPTRTVQTQPRATVPATTQGTTTAAVGSYYSIQSGDTYGSIATRFGTTVAALEQLNPGVSPNALRVGQRIRVK